MRTVDFDMVCSCGAGLQINVDDENLMTSAMVFLNRFADAHAKCGFMTQMPPLGHPTGRSINLPASTEDDSL